MFRAQRTARRLQHIDRAHRAAIENGPLWSYVPHPDPRFRVAFTAMSDRSNRSTIRSVAVDGRCLQHVDYADRGIGRYTSGALQLLAELRPDWELLVVTDPDLPPIDRSRLPATAALGESPPPSSPAMLFLDPAPMTHPPSRLDGNTYGRRVALVYDFIPAHAPNIYCPTTEDADEYLARLRRLSSFDQLACISGSVTAECRTRLPGHTVDTLPLPIDRPTPAQHVEGLPTTFLFAPLGADRRKNLPGAVAVLAGLDAAGWDGHLVILSHLPDDHRLELNRLASAVGLDHRRFHAVAGLSSGQVATMYVRAAAAVLPTFDEGLSLPILEAAHHGCPIVASAIRPHRDLLGPGERFGDPMRPSTFVGALLSAFDDPQAAVDRQRAALDAVRRSRPSERLATIVSGRRDATTSEANSG